MAGKLVCMMVVVMVGGAQGRLGRNFADGDEYDGHGNPIQKNACDYLPYTPSCNGPLYFCNNECRTSIFVFGDSLSDMGTANVNNGFFGIVQQVVGDAAPKESAFPYTEFSFTSPEGVWARQLEDYAWSQVYGYAIGAARASFDDQRDLAGVPIVVPGLLKQIEQFLVDKPVVKKGDIAVISIGNNDFSEIPGLIQDQLVALALAGQNIQDLAIVQNVTNTVATQVSAAVVQAIATGVAQIKAYSPKIKVVVFGFIAAELIPASAQSSPEELIFLKQVLLLTEAAIKQNIPAISFFNQRQVWETEIAEAQLAGLNVTVGCGDNINVCSSFFGCPSCSPEELPTKFFVDDLHPNGDFNTVLAGEVYDFLKAQVPKLKRCPKLLDKLGVVSCRHDCHL